MKSSLLVNIGFMLFLNVKKLAIFQIKNEYKLIGHKPLFSNVYLMYRKS